MSGSLDRVPKGVTASGQPCTSNVMAPLLLRKAHGMETKVRGTSIGCWVQVQVAALFRIEYQHVKKAEDLGSATPRLVITKSILYFFDMFADCTTELRKGLCKSC